MKGILVKPDIWKGKQKAFEQYGMAVTRRVIKLSPDEWDYMRTNNDGRALFWIRADLASGDKFPDYNNIRLVKPRYQHGETVYIKEAWRIVQAKEDSNSDFAIAYPDGELKFWRDNGNIMNYPIDERRRSPLFLPAKFARYFIKITDVRAERLQSITEEDAVREGFNSLAEFIAKFEDINFRLPAYERNEKGNLVITHYNTFRWEEGHRVESYRGKPHYIIGNPWVFRYEFIKADPPQNITD